MVNTFDKKQQQQIGLCYIRIYQYECKLSYPNINFKYIFLST